MLEELRAPFPADRVSWRVGSTNGDKTRGLALAYIDARDVQDRLDQVCGAENWQNSFPHANGKTVCRISIRINGEWIGKEDGAGDTDVEAEKGALSDAFKRAAVKWGIGRYLYDLDSPWVELEPAGRSFRIKESEHAKLRALLDGKRPDKQAERKPDVKPVALQKPKDGWYPITATAFTKQFLDIAHRLPKGQRQEHYKLNETLINDLRGASSQAADYLDQKFAEINDAAA